MSVSAHPDPAFARVLADPTRRRILDLVATARVPVDVAALTAHLGVHHNTVRQHLAKLRAVGLVEETREEREAPGRPRLLYTSGWAEPVHARVARGLVRAVASGSTPRQAGRALGAEDAVGLDALDALDALEIDAARHGFAPRRQGSEIVFDACPVAALAAESPKVVCALHRGMAEGVCAAVGGAKVTRFVARDPFDAGCRIEVDRP